MLSSSKGGPPTALQIPARDDARSALLAARHQRLQRRTQSGASDATQKVVRSWTGELGNTGFLYIYYTHNIWVGEYVILVYVCIDELAQAWFLLYKHDYHMFLFGWEMKINKNRSQAAVDLPLQPVKSDKFKGQPNWCAGNNDWFLRRRQTKVGDAIFDLYDVKLQNFPYSVQSSNPYVMNLYENERNHTWDWDSLSKAGVCVCAYEASSPLTGNTSVWKHPVTWLVEMSHMDDMVPKCYF